MERGLATISFQPSALSGQHVWKDYVPEELRRDLRKQPRGLVEHCERVRQVNRELAIRHGFEPAKAEAAALIHDIARGLDNDELRDLARRFGLRPSELEKRLPVLIHGEIGAELLRRDYAVTDREILDAVACHTTGKRGMGMLDEILFLSDKLEPEKIAFRPELAEVRRLAEQNLDAAALRFFDLKLAWLTGGNHQIHPQMVEARNDLLTRLR